ncbi:MAG: CHAD domain-containing protein [Chloroflexota bacterium]
MALEREIKLGAPREFQLPAFVGLGAGLVAAPTVEQSLETVYYDTPDLRLARWGYSLRRRLGEGWTLKRPMAATDAVLTRDELTFAGEGEQPPEEALRLLRVYARRAAIMPMARLSTVRRRVRIQTAAGVTAAEVVDDQVTVLDNATRFRQVEVELGPAADADLLARLVSRLDAAGAGPSDPTPKHLRALGPGADAPPEVVPGELPRRPSAGDVARLAIAGSIAALFRHDLGARLGDDPEDVHQARVAIRRLRSDLRTFSSLLDVEWRDGLQGDLRWLATELGAARDADVLLRRVQAQAEQLPPEDSEAAQRLIGLAREEAVQAQRQLQVALDAERYLDLAERLVLAATAPPLLPAATKRATGVLPAMVARPWRRLRRAVEALPTEPTDADLHRVRILAKRCRYAAEAVVPVVKRRAARFARATGQLQTVLGEHQDSVRLQAWLRTAGRPADVTLVAGELLAMERAAANVLRTNWRKAWRTLDRKTARSWLP